MIIMFIKDLAMSEIGSFEKFLIESGCRITRKDINISIEVGSIYFDLNDNVEAVFKNSYVFFIDYKKAKAFKIFLEDFNKMEVY